MKNIPHAIPVSPAQLYLNRKQAQAEARTTRRTAFINRLLDATIAGMLAAMTIIAVLYYIAPPIPLFVEPHTDSIMEGIAQL